MLKILDLQRAKDSSDSKKFKVRVSYLTGGGKYFFMQFNRQSQTLR